MRRRQILSALAAVPVIAPVVATAMAAGPARAQVQPPSPLAVVASFSILADMVRQIGGDAVSVTGLVPPDGDPHGYEPRPSDLRALVAARLLVLNGLGLEGWMTRLVGSSGYRGPVAIASTGIKPRSMAEDGGATVTDPHAWQDARNGASYARTIAAGLGRADPAQAARLHDAGERYAAEIMQTDAWIEQQFAPIPPARRIIITTHDAFGYFGARYGVKMLAAEGISTDAEPSARDIARLVAQIRRDRVRAVFLESMTDPRLAAMLARESGAALGAKVYSDALSPPGGPADTYLKMFRHNVPLFVAAMQPTG
jgi:zinc/manganese transport system substrate-binding protein